MPDVECLIFFLWLRATAQPDQQGSQKALLRPRGPMPPSRTTSLTGDVVVGHNKKFERSAVCLAPAHVYKPVPMGVIAHAWCSAHYHMVINAMAEAEYAGQHD